MALLRSRKPKDPQEDDNAPILIASSGSAARNNSRNIPLIIAREFRSRVQKRSFVIATAVLLALVVIASFIPTVIQVVSSGSQTKLAVVNEAGQIAGGDPNATLDSVLNVTNTSTANNTATTSTSTKKEFDIQAGSASDLAGLRQRVKDGKLDALLTITRNGSGDLAFDYYTNGSATGVQSSRIQAAASQLNFTDKLARAGVPQAQLAGLYTPPAFKAVGTSDERSGRSQAETIAGYIVAFIGVILIYMVITQYGVQVAQGAAEEKSNRVMEIMINAATPFQLMIGKIIGIGLSGLVQMVVVLAGAAVALLAQGPIKNAFISNSTSSGTDVDITGLSLGLIGLLGIYFVLGYLLYAALFGAVGSLVSRQEDVQSALAPLTLILLAAYLAGIFGLQSADAVWVVVLSYVPFFTPVLMLARAGVGTVAWWEVPVSIVILIVTILAMTWVAARIYRAGVLMYGQKPSFGRLIKLARSR